MAVILALLLLECCLTSDLPFGLWTMVLLLPAGFVIWMLLEWSLRPLIRTRCARHSTSSVPPACPG